MCYAWKTWKICNHWSGTTEECGFFMFLNERIFIYGCIISLWVNFIIKKEVIPMSWQGIAESMKVTLTRKRESSGMKLKDREPTQGNKIESRSSWSSKTKTWGWGILRLSSCKYLCAYAHCFAVAHTRRSVFHFVWHRSLVCWRISQDTCLVILWGFPCFCHPFVTRQLRWKMGRSKLPHPALWEL